jgi:hypothetical protein
MFGERVRTNKTPTRAERSARTRSRPKKKAVWPHLLVASRFPLGA